MLPRTPTPVHLPSGRVLPYNLRAPSPTKLPLLTTSLPGSSLPTSRASSPVRIPTGAISPNTLLPPPPASFSKKRLAHKRSFSFNDIPVLDGNGVPRGFEEGRYRPALPTVKEAGVPMRGEIRRLSFTLDKRRRGEVLGGKFVSHHGGSVMDGRKVCGIEC